MTAVFVPELKQVEVCLDQYLFDLILKQVRLKRFLCPVSFRSTPYRDISKALLVLAAKELRPFRQLVLQILVDAYQNRVRFA